MNIMEIAVVGAVVLIPVIIDYGWESLYAMKEVQLKYWNQIGMVMTVMGVEKAEKMCLET